MIKSKDRESSNMLRVIVHSFAIFSIYSILISTFVTLLLVPNTLLASTNTTALNQGPSFLKVVVRVDNTGGGTAKPTDFEIFIHANNNPDPWHLYGSDSGTVVAMTGRGTYEVDVRQDSLKTKYGKFFSGDCKLNESGNGSDSINSGDKKTCIVTMTFPNF